MPGHAQTLTCVHTDVREQGPPLVTRLLLQVLSLEKERMKEALTTKEHDYDRLVTDHASELESLNAAATASNTKQRELERELREKDEGLELLRADLQVAPH
jgi:anti-sigma-K factor RskA